MTGIVLTFAAVNVLVVLCIVLDDHSKRLRKLEGQQPKPETEQ